MATIDEETNIVFNEYSDLSYRDDGYENIDLYVQYVCVGDIEVFTDRENGNREYICVNYEVLYLDTIKKRT